jgi:peroxiredoxin Q/BCP
MKKMYGKEVRGIERSTFLLDAKGVLRREFRGVKVPGHVEQIVEAVQAL